MDDEDRIIVALDVDGLGRAKSLVEELAPYVGCFKIGLEFINAMLASVISPEAEGDALANLQKIRELFRLLSGKIFWDGKFDDIPNTVGAASRVIAGLNVKMYNVHASAGIKAMMAAVANKGSSSLVLAVTVLTSLDEKNAHLIFGSPSQAKVLQLARDAKLAGCDGIICSPQELAFLREQKELNGLLRVTPGVRPNWAALGDQSRVMTPGEAVEAGADMLVIGRPITKPPAPIESSIKAAKLIADEIAAVRKRTS